jgi:hypothetical protein
MGCIFRNENPKFFHLLGNSNLIKSLLVFINLSLSAINLYGFYKCSGCNNLCIKLEHNKKMSEMKKKLGQQGAKMFMNNLLGGVFGSK